MEGASYTQICLEATRLKDVLHFETFGHSLDIPVEIGLPTPSSDAACAS